MKRIIASKKSVYAAENEDNRVSDMISLLKDDFDYALEGFEKLERIGDVDTALSIMSNLSDSINIAIQESANQIVN